jgi:hypothetical protein
MSVINAFAQWYRKLSLEREEIDRAYREPEKKFSIKYNGSKNIETEGINIISGFCADKAKNIIDKGMVEKEDIDCLKGYVNRLAKIVNGKKWPGEYSRLIMEIKKVIEEADEYVITSTTNGDLELFD